MKSTKQSYKIDINYIYQFCRTKLWVLPLTLLTAISCKNDSQGVENSVKEIISVTPRNGVPGTKVTIQAIGFTPDSSKNEVFINDSPCEIINVSQATITAEVPSGATSGFLSIEVEDESVKGPYFLITRPKPDGKPIIQGSDPTIVSHEISSKGVVIGFSELGGGYINYLDLGDGQNVIAPGYGRGGQSSIRDMLHSGKYNPTQAGYRDGAGVPVELIIENSESGPGKRLSIPRYNLPLFNGDGVFNFVEHENLYSKGDHYAEGDADGIREPGLSQDYEVRSEFDYQGYTEDASNLVDNQIAAFKHVFFYEYSRNPGMPIEEGEQPETYSAIYQAGKSAVKVNGEPLIIEDNRIKDISPSYFSSQQEATDIDFSGIQLSYVLRLTEEADFTHFMWLDQQGEWQSQSNKNVIRLRMSGDKYIYLLPSGEIRRPITDTGGSNLLMLATGNDPATSKALALYAPEKARNNAQVIEGVHRNTGDTEYTEDRRMRTIGLGGPRGGKPGSTKNVEGAEIPNFFWTLGIRKWLTGMFAPNHGDKNVLERLKMEVYILIGTPNEIREATKSIEAKLG